MPSLVTEELLQAWQKISALVRENEQLREALSAKLRQYDTDMRTLQTALNAEIAAKRTANIEIERLRHECQRWSDLRDADIERLRAIETP